MTSADANQSDNHLEGLEDRIRVFTRLARAHPEGVMQESNGEMDTPCGGSSDRLRQFKADLGSDVAKLEGSEYIEKATSAKEKYVAGLGNPQSECNERHL
jgi:hypothetical protein